MLQVSSGKEGSNKDVIMVDPLEAKRLAAKQMVQIKGREKLKVNKFLFGFDIVAYVWKYTI